MKYKIATAILGVTTILLLIVSIFIVTTTEAKIEEQEAFFQEELTDVMIPDEWYEQDGFDNLNDWWATITQKKIDNANIASDTMSNYSDYLTEEQVNRLTEISNQIQDSHSVTEIDSLVNEVNEIAATAQQAKDAAELEKQQQQQQEQAAASEVEQTSYADDSSSYSGYSGGNTNNFKSAGVIYQNGRKYTWYSSNVLHHYMTDQWTAGEDGIYRDADGYVVAGTDDLPYGSTVDTPFGEGKIYDCGASGVIDIYTNF